MNDDEKIVLTPDEAISLLPDGPHVHNYANPNHGMFLGIDYSRADAEKHIRDAFACEIAGPHCKSINHALAVWERESDRRPTFFETDMRKVDAMETSKREAP